MKYLLVTKYPTPTQMAVVEEFDTLPLIELQDSQEVMTPIRFEAWKQEPEQVAWQIQMESSLSQAKAAQEQAEAQAKADALEAEIQLIMTTFNFNREQAELIYNLQVKNANK